MTSRSKSCGRSFKAKGHGEPGRSIIKISRVLRERNLFSWADQLKKPDFSERVLLEAVATLKDDDDED